MGILINGEMVWQVGDIVYCQLDELLKGPFVIFKVLSDGSYLGRFVGGMAWDFSVNYQVKSEDIRIYSAKTMQSGYH